MPLWTHCYFEGCYNHLIDQGQTSSGPLSDVALKNRCLDNDKDPKSVHTNIDLNPRKIVHFGIWCVGLSLPSFSTTSGDHAHFFKGEALGYGINNGSLTGTYLTLFPRWVFNVMTSKMSVFDPESLILGIEQVVYAAGMERSFK